VLHIQRAVSCQSITWMTGISLFRLLTRYVGCVGSPHGTRLSSEYPPYQVREYGEAVSPLPATHRIRIPPRNAVFFSIVQLNGNCCVRLGARKFCRLVLVAVPRHTQMRMPCRKPWLVTSGSTCKSEEAGPTILSVTLSSVGERQNIIYVVITTEASLEIGKAIGYNESNLIFG